MSPRVTARTFDPVVRRGYVVVVNTWRLVKFGFPMQAAVLASALAVEAQQQILDYYPCAD